MLHAGLGLGCGRLDVCLVVEDGEGVEVGVALPDAGGLAKLVDRGRERYGPQPVRAAVESMNGARFVHDRLERFGWEVEVGEAVKVKGLAPLACKTDRIDVWVLAGLSRRDLVPAIWLPSFEMRQERERARWRLFLVRERTALKNRVHAQLLAFGHPCPVSGLFGRRGRALLEQLAFPGPWRANVLAAVAMIEQLDQEIDAIEKGAPAARCRSPVRAAAEDRARDRLGAQLHDRGRTRRHQPLQLTDEAGWLHRPLPACASVRQHRPARAPQPCRSPIPTLGARRSGCSRLPPRPLPRPLRTQQAPARQTTRRQSRPDRRRPPHLRSDLAHAHPKRTLRSGKRQRHSGRIDGPLGNAPPERAPIQPFPSTRRR